VEGGNCIYARIGRKKGGWLTRVEGGGGERKEGAGGEKVILGPMRLRHVCTIPRSVGDLFLFRGGQGLFHLLENENKKRKTSPIIIFWACGKKGDSVQSSSGKKKKEAT